MYKLLIADDEALEREALIFFVRNSPLEIGEIIECTNGNDVVRQMFLQQPDILILDINMPGLNGLEAFKQFKNVEHPYRVIYSTAYDYFDYAVKALQLGAMDFLIKPLKKETLLSILIKSIDQLDAEAEKQKKQIKFNTVLDVFGESIMKKLITGEVDEKVLHYLDVVDIPYDTKGQCICIKTMEDIDEDRKNILIKYLKEELSYLKIKILNNWRNEMLTIIVFCLSNHKEHIFDKADERVKNIFKRNKIAFIFGKGEVFEDLNQIEQSYEIARECVGDISFDKESMNGSKNHEISDTIKKIKEYIEINYDKRLTLDIIADKAGYSKFYINRIFKQQMNTTVIDYLIQVRIRKAKELLVKDTYSVKQISSIVGYSEPNYFTLTFKKAEGISPLKFRYQSKGEE